MFKSPQTYRYCPHSLLTALIYANKMSQIIVLNTFYAINWYSFLTNYRFNSLFKCHLSISIFHSANNFLWIKMKSGQWQITNSWLKTQTAFRLKLMIMERIYYVSFSVSKSPYHCISMTWWLRTSTRTRTIWNKYPIRVSFTATSPINS